MPTYDYKCPDCGVIYSIQHSINDTKKQKCAVCGVPMRKAFTAIPAHFKGEGFYTTDKFKE